MTHRRECQCVECLRDHGDWLEFLRLIGRDTEPDDREDDETWADSLDSLDAEPGDLWPRVAREARP